MLREYRMPPKLSQLGIGTRTIKCNVENAGIGHTTIVHCDLRLLIDLSFDRLSNLGLYLAPLASFGTVLSNDDNAALSPGEPSVSVFRDLSLARLLALSLMTLESPGKLPSNLLTESELPHRELSAEALVSRIAGDLLDTGAVVMLNPRSLFLTLAFTATSHAALAGFLVPQLPQAVMHQSPKNTRPVQIMRPTIGLEPLRAFGDPLRLFAHPSPTI
jgi:hypothetical protein